MKQRASASERLAWNQRASRHSGAPRSGEPGIHNHRRCVVYVYLLASAKHGTLYVGVTNDLVRRVYQHKTGVFRGFTFRYQVHRLVWFESYDDPTNAIVREKEIKKWRREWKVNLIERSNPEWVDLYESIAS
jgi:putative endonuclease